MAFVKPLLPPLQPSSLLVHSGSGKTAALLSPLLTQLHFPNLPSPRSVPPSPAFNSLSKVVEAPSEPMPWIWSCHKCHARYPLGATRRCLNDGHYFCGGVTVNTITGKTKRHRACASEFDYIGWEEYGKWKRRVSQDRTEGDLRQHCEHKCDFPSACHWKTKHSPKTVATFDFLDPQCLGRESAAASSPASEKETPPPFKKTGLYIDKIVKAAEKRTSQLTTLLSTIDEERNFASMPSYIPSPASIGPKLLELPSLHGLGLSFPVLDFSNFQKHFDTPRNVTKGLDSDDTSRVDSPPELSSSTTTTEDDDVEMTEWLSDDQSLSSLPLSPKSKNSSDEVPFNFSTDPSHGPRAFLSGDDDASPFPARRNAWDWTAGDIGVALGSPTKPIFEEVF